MVFIMRILPCAVLHKCQDERPSAVSKGNDKLRDKIRGYIAYLQAINPLQAARLLEQFNAIQWTHSQTK